MTDVQQIPPGQPPVQHPTPDIPEPQHPGEYVSVQQFLPPGVDPLDRSVVVREGQHLDEGHIPPDYTGPQYERGRRAFARDNWEALPVYQRAAKNFTVRIVVVDINSGGTAIACNEQRGRVSVTMSIPSKLADGSTVPNGVTFSANEGDLQLGAAGPASNACGVLNPGDSVTIATEAKIYVGLIGANATGAVMVITTNNPPGGPGVQ